MEVSLCCSVVLAGLVLKGGFWAFVVCVSCCGCFVVFLVESASFVGVCVVLCRLCVCLDVKRVVSLFSVLHLSSVVCFVFHDYVFSFVLVCLVQWLHVLVSVSLFCVVCFVVDLFGVRVFCGLFGLFGLVFVVSLSVLVFCVCLEFPCSFGFFVDVVLVVCLVVWSFEWVLVVLVSLFVVFYQCLVLVVCVVLCGFSGLCVVLRLDCVFVEFGVLCFGLCVVVVMVFFGSVLFDIE